MSKTITLRCPVYVEELDDVCGKPIEVDAWKGEPQTHWYPGSPPGFDIYEAECGHSETIFENYYDEIMQHLTDLELDAMERAAERRIERFYEKALKGCILVTDGTGREISTTDL